VRIRTSGVVVPEMVIDCGSLNATMGSYSV
jgi:hypothetical protein